MTKKQVQSAVKSLIEQNVLKEFITKYQSTGLYQQYHIMQNDSATLVVYSNMIEIRTDNASIQAMFRHLWSLKYHYLTPTIGTLHAEYRYTGKNHDTFTISTINIEHKAGL